MVFVLRMTSSFLRYRVISVAIVLAFAANTFDRTSFPRIQLFRGSRKATNPFSTSRGDSLEMITPSGSIPGGRGGMARRSSRISSPARARVIHLLRWAAGTRSSAMHSSTLRSILFLRS